MFEASYVRMPRPSYDGQPVVSKEFPWDTAWLHASSADASETGAQYAGSDEGDGGDGGDGGEGGEGGEGGKSVGDIGVGDGGGR